MKRISVLLAVLAIFITTTALASVLFNGQVTSMWSTDQTATATVVTGPCVLHGIVVKTDGTNDVTITIADAAGTTYLVPA